ncbi:MAG: transposase family protein [Pseudonocardiaceae bacterium]
MRLRVFEDYSVWTTHIVLVKPHDATREVHIVPLQRNHLTATRTDRDLPAAALDGLDLLRRFASVSDGRPGQGRDHPVAVVLTLCAAAVLAGMRSFTAIAGWVADVPVELLA